MPIPYSVLLKAVPWTEVIRNAPQIIDGARRLWKATDRRAATGASDAAGSAAPGGAGQYGPALGERVVALERAAADDREQLRASSELINALAEQNAQLVARVDALGRRVLVLTVATAVLALGLVAAVASLAT
jgi:hypothetical protein